jgi:hypothetical protein
MSVLLDKYKPVSLQELIESECDSSLFEVENKTQKTFICHGEQGRFPLRCYYDCIIEFEVHLSEVMEEVSLEETGTVICSRKNTKHAVFTELSIPTPLITSYFNHFMLVVKNGSKNSISITVSYKDCLFNENLHHRYITEMAVFVVINGEVTVMTYEKRALFAAWKNKMSK